MSLFLIDAAGATCTLGAMNPLATYLKAANLTHQDFAAILGTDRSTVTRWTLTGPGRLEAARQIERATQGAVPLSAWSDYRPQAAE